MSRMLPIPRKWAGKAFREIPAVKKRDQQIEKLLPLQYSFKTPSFHRSLRSAYREEKIFHEIGGDWGAFAGLGHKDGKHEMRAVAEALGLKIPKLLGSWETLDDIPWDEMPDAFVLKTEYGHSGKGVAPLRRIDGGWQIINSTRTGTLEEVLEPLKNKLGEAGAHGTFLAEEFLGSSDENKLPVDLKIYSFYGQPAVLMVRKLVDFYGGRKGKRAAYFDESGNRAKNLVSAIQLDDSIALPELFEEAMEIAARASLAVRLPHARIDLYQHEGEIYFGELTPMCGRRLTLSFGDEWDKYLGELWEYAQVRLKTDLAVGNINTSGPVIRTGTTPIQKDLFKPPSI